MPSYQIQSGSLLRERSANLLDLNLGSGVSSTQDNEETLGKMCRACLSNVNVTNFITAKFLLGLPQPNLAKGKTNTVNGELKLVCCPNALLEIWPPLREKLAHYVRQIAHSPDPTRRVSLSESYLIWCGGTSCLRSRATITYRVSINSIAPISSTCSFAFNPQSVRRRGRDSLDLIKGASITKGTESDFTGNSSKE